MALTIEQQRALAMARARARMAEAPALSEPAPAPPANPPSALASIAQGIRDPFDAAAQMLAHKFPETSQALDQNPAIQSLGLDNNAPQKMDQGIASREAAYQAQRGGTQDADWPRIGGNIAGTLPLAMATAPIKAGLLGKAAIGGATGAGFGTLQPVTDPKADFWKTKEDQAKQGGMIGAVAGPGMELAARAIAPRVSSAVQNLMNRGVTPTPGQISGGWVKGLEDKATSIPLLGDIIKSGQRRAVDDLNRAAYKEALNPIGAKASKVAGRAGVDDTALKLESFYDSKMPGLSLQLDEPLQQQLKDIANSANLPQAQSDQLGRLIQHHVFSKMPEGSMEGKAAQGAISDLSREASGYSTDSSFDNRRLGGALNNVVDSMRSALERSNPAAAQDLASANNGYANYARIRDAASRTGSKSGVFSPAQLQAAVRAGDKSAGKGAFARGNARMQNLSDDAVKVLGNDYPDSGSVGRAMLPLMMGGGLAGAYATPWALAGAGAALPYTPIGQKAVAALMASRPSWAQPVADTVRSIPASLSAFYATQQRGQ